jgi:hypothetical protein
MAERTGQPHLREYIDLERLVMADNEDGKKATGQSHVIVRAGLYAEARVRSS